MCLVHREQCRQVGHQHRGSAEGERSLAREAPGAGSGGQQLCPPRPERCQASTQSCSSGGHSHLHPSRKEVGSSACPPTHFQASSSLWAGIQRRQPLGTGQGGHSQGGRDQRGWQRRASLAVSVEPENASIVDLPRVLHFLAPSSLHAGTRASQEPQGSRPQGHCASV